MVTVQRTIQDRFPAGRQRTAWLRWFSQAASYDRARVGSGRLCPRTGVVGTAARTAEARDALQEQRSTPTLRLVVDKKLH
jgi:hypothetical protein